jgi:predicted sugar kinase
VGFVVDQVALGQVFSEYFGFLCQSSFHPISPQSPSPIIRGWYNRPVVAAVPKVPPHKFKKKKENVFFFSFLLQLYSV